MKDKKQPNAGENTPKKTYNPRIDHDWVPAFLAVVMTVAKCLFVASPYIAIIFSTDGIAQSLNSIGSDETFNMVWVMTVTFWVGKKLSDKQK